MATPVDQVLKDFEAARSYHDSFVEKCERRYRSYRGVLERKSEAAKWTSKQHPPYVFQIIETIVGNLIEDQLSFRLKARPFMSDMAEIAQRRNAAEALEHLLAYEHALDHFHEKQRPFALQASITGLSVGKVYWKYERGVVSRQQMVPEPIQHPITGQPIGFAETRKTVRNVETLCDDPTFEVVDVRDFLWHEAAPSLDKAKYVIHRVWMTYDELKSLAARGMYDAKGVEKVKESRDFSADASYREQSLFNRDRTKDLIEVLEYWTDSRVITIANRNILLSDKANPFHHGCKPFVTATTMPDLFQIPGVSDVEIVEELQEMLWTVMNQRLDNLMLINNAIVLMRSDIDDPDMFEFAPGERWLVDDPQQVTMWTPNPVPAEVSLNAEQAIKGDLQNITGGMPFVAGADSNVDQKTATGVSIVTSLAQKRLAAKKSNFMYAYRRVAEQQIGLLQQFMTEDRIVQIVGKDGAAEWKQIAPEEIQGRFLVDVTPMADSLMRQEDRAEKQALVTTASQLAPIMQAVGQPLNLTAFVEEWLRSYGIDDPQRFFSAQPQAQLPPDSPGGQPQGPPPGSSGGGGITSPLATAPQISPSTPGTMAPSTFMQQALAQHGGANNL